jgi:hypothetical protein
VRGCNAGVGGELLREVDGGVADIDAGDGLRTEVGQAERVLAAVALEMHDPSAANIAEQVELFAAQIAPATAEEGGLIALMAVVRDGGGVPGQAVVLVKLAVGRVAHRPHPTASPASLVRGDRATG